MPSLLCPPLQAAAAAGSGAHSEEAVESELAALERAHAAHQAKVEAIRAEMSRVL